jgi:hypothetical protein
MSAHATRAGHFVFFSQYHFSQAAFVSVFSSLLVAMDVARLPGCLRRGYWVLATKKLHAALRLWVAAA